MHYVALLLVLFALPASALAVLPPDILFSVGTQLWQIVAGVGALAVGSLASLFPFLRNATFSSVRFRKILISSGVTLMLFSLGYLLYLLSTPSAPTPTTHQGKVGTTTGYEFYANHFVFYGTKSSGERVLINMDINRKEVSGGNFAHYYFVDMINGSTTKSVYAEQELQTHEMGNNFFFSNFLRLLPEDHSAREQYVFAFTRDGHTYNIHSEMLTADFLIKNEPTYTAYVGVGRADGIVDGEHIKFHVMSERIYSNDHRVSVFFDTEGTLQSQSAQLVLWDEKGDFYMIDRSIVAEYSPAYTSHFWGLTKNNEGWMRRYFEGEAVAVGAGRGFRAQLGAHNGDKEFELSMVQKFDNGYNEGYVDGVVRLDGETRSVSGLGAHRIYGKE